MEHYLLTFLISSVLAVAQALASNVQVVTDFPGVALESGNLLSVALPLINNSEDTGATALTITAITLNSGIRNESMTFPVVLGSFSAGQRAVVDARFVLTVVDQSARYLLTVAGTYKVAGQVLGFQVNRPLVLPDVGPGSASLRTGFVDQVKVSGGPFASRPVPNDDEHNPQGRPVPIGPARFVFGPTPTTSLVKTSVLLP